MTLVRSPFDVELVGREHGGPRVTREDRLCGRTNVYTFDVATQYKRQRYVIVSSNLNTAYEDLAREVKSAITSAGTHIPSYTAFEPGASEKALAVNESRMPVATLAAMAALGVGLFKVVQWWKQRERPAAGFEDGREKTILVTEIDGKAVEVNTARAFVRMRKAASEAGVVIKVSSGFRTMSEQRFLYDCYINCNCNDCNMAEPPGFSKHQSGRALDLNSRGPGVLAWLRRHAREFGFAETVPGEPWHWERKDDAR